MPDSVRPLFVLVNPSSDNANHLPVGLFLLSFKMTTSFLAVTAALLCVAILLINVLSVIGYIFGWKRVKISGKLSLALSVIVTLFGLALTVAFMQSLIRAA